MSKKLGLAGAALATVFTAQANALDLDISALQPAAEPEATYADGIIDNREIESYEIVKNDAGKPVTYNGRTLFVAETTDGATVLGTSSSGFNDGPSVRGLDDKLFLNPDGTPMELADVKKQDGVSGFEIAASVEVEEPMGPFAGTAFDDGQVTSDDVEDYSHLPGLDACEAQEWAAWTKLNEADGISVIPDTVGKIGFKPSEDGAFALTVDGRKPVTIKDAAGNAFCGLTTSSYEDGVTVTGLNNGILNTEETGPASCEDIFGLNK